MSIYEREPSDKWIDDYVKEFESDDANKYHAANYNAVIKCVQKFHPNDHHYENIFLKVTLINDAFKAGVRDTMGLAKCIFNNSQNIDSRLKTKDYSLLKDLQCYTNKDKTYRFYSFATKYCHCHYPDKYYIYDSFVKTSLIQFHRNHSPKMEGFIQNRLVQYDYFEQVMDNFKATFNLTVSNQAVDRFLWGIGKKNKPKSNKKKML